MLPKIILLNGPSSSGKSTLAKNLQKYMLEKSQKYNVVSIDDFLKMNSDEPIYEDDVFEISSKLYAKALATLKRQENVIIDHVITSKRIYDELISALKEYLLIKIHITCPLQELKRREFIRNNRCIGSAEASYEYLYPKENYDLTIDTFELSEQECVSKIAELIL